MDWGSNIGADITTKVNIVAITALRRDVM